MAFGTARRAAESAATRWRALAGTAARAQVWVRVLATALGAGALAGAGQLGVAYGLGLLHFPLPVIGPGTGTGVSGRALTGGVWAAQLTWVAWLAILAVLAGSAGGAWAARRRDRSLEMGARISVSVVAGLGAAVVVPLTALPAREATLVGPELGQPALDAGLAAGLGLVVGILAAVALLSVRLVAVSVTLLVAVVWLLALVSVAPSLGPTADLPEVRLAVLDLPALSGGARSTVAVLSAPVLALLVCGVIALAARSSGLPPLLTAVSSAAAPGVLALAYLIGSPGTGERAVQTSPYAGALIAVAAGLLVSLGVGAVRLPSKSADGPEPPDGAGPGASDEPEELGGSGESASPMPHVPPSPLLSQPLSPPPDTTATGFSMAPPQWAVEPLESSEETTEPPYSAPAPISPAPADLPAWPAPPEPPAPRPTAAEPATPPEPPASSALDTTLEPIPFPPIPQPRPTLDDLDIPAESEPLAGPETGASPESGETGESAVPMPEPPAKPSRRLRLPRVGRKSKRQPKEPEEAAPAAAPVSPAPPPEPADPEPATAESATPTDPAPEPPTSHSTAPTKRRRRGEAEHVDWISSLSGGPEEEPAPEQGRRRLRRERDLDSSTDEVPDPPSWPANESPDDTDPPSLLRPYVSRDRPSPK